MLKIRRCPIVGQLLFDVLAAVCTEAVLALNWLLIYGQALARRAQGERCFPRSQYCPVFHVCANGILE